MRISSFLSVYDAFGVPVENVIIPIESEVLCPISILLRHVMRIGIRTFFSKPVHGTAHARRPSVEDMGIDHRGLYILLTEKFLDGPNVVTAFEQVRGEGVP
jgi:hypothetical protein